MSAKYTFKSVKIKYCCFPRVLFEIKFKRTFEALKCIAFDSIIYYYFLWKITLFMFVWKRGDSKRQQQQPEKKNTGDNRENKK